MIAVEVEVISPSRLSIEPSGVYHSAVESPKGWCLRKTAVYFCRQSRGDLYGRLAYVRNVDFAHYLHQAGIA